jgi:hypothetical protein
VLRTQETDNDPCAASKRIPPDLNHTWEPIADACGSSTSPGAFYSITSSARASSVGGTVIPSALAVVRFTASVKSVGRSNGRSPAFAPGNILSREEPSIANNKIALSKGNAVGRRELDDVPPLRNGPDSPTSNGSGKTESKKVTRYLSHFVTSLAAPVASGWSVCRMGHNSAPGA